LATKEAQSLLSRIQKPQRIIWKETHKEPSEGQLLLLHRIKVRRWRKNTIASTTGLIRELVNDIKFILHVRKCEMCMAEVTIGIERYGGSRLPWYLNVNEDIAEVMDWETEDLEPVLTWGEQKRVETWDPSLNPIMYDRGLLKDCPRIRDYKMGSFWTGWNMKDKTKQQAYFRKTHRETVRFATDRMAWAEKIIRQQIMETARYLKDIINWNFDWENLPFLGCRNARIQPYNSGRNQKEMRGKRLR